MRPSRWQLLLICCCITGCSTPPNVSEQQFRPRFRAEAKDVPSEQRFLITLKSLDDRTLCLRYFQWPNRFGELADGVDWVKLSFSAGARNPQAHGLAVDYGGGAIQIAPFSTLTGFIQYSEFGDPEGIRKLRQRRLVFMPAPWVCRQ